MQSQKVEQLKIAFVTPYFHPLKGGVEHNCLNMALQSAKSGHEVHVLTSDRRFGKKIERQQQEYEGIHIHRLRRLFFRQYYLSFLPGLFSELRRGEFDVIHTHVPGIIWNDFTLILLRIFAKKKFVSINTPHDPFMSRNAYSFPVRILRRLYLIFLRLYYSRLYDHVVAVNPHQHLWICDMYQVDKSQIVLVMNGIDERMLEETEVEDSTMQTLGVDRQLIITNVARYHEYKGHQHILAAINMIKNRKQLGIQYVGIGVDSGMLPRLQNYVRNNKLEKYVTLLENPNDSVRDQILTKAEIYISASRVEAFGLGALEAMAKHTSIIATKTEGSLYLIEDSKNGVLYEFGDVEALRDAIVLLAEKPKLRAALVENNYQKAQQYTWDETFRNYDKLLHQINS